MGDLRIAIVAGTLLLSAMPAAAQAAWTRIGAAPINDSANHVTIPIAHHPHYREARICVSGHAAQLNSALISFDAGANQTVPINALVPAAGCTRPFVLRGRGAAGLTAIRIAYDPPSLGHRRVALRIFAR